MEQTRELTAAAAVDVSLHVAPSVPRLVCVDSFHLKQVWRGRREGGRTLARLAPLLSAPLWEQILIDGLAKTLRYASGTIYILVQRKRDVAEGVRHTLVVEAFRKGTPSKATAAAQSPEAVLESLGTGGPAPVGMRAHNVAQFLYTSRQIVQAMAGSVAVDELAGGLLRLTLSVPYTEPTDAEVEVRGWAHHLLETGPGGLHAMPPPAAASSCACLLQRARLQAEPEPDVSTALPPSLVAFSQVRLWAVPLLRVSHSNRGSSSPRRAWGSRGRLSTHQRHSMR